MLKLEASLLFDQVLLVGGDDVKVGEPTVDGASVEATVVGDGKAKKVIVYKYKRKTGYHKRMVTDSSTQKLRLTRSTLN